MRQEPIDSLIGPFAETEMAISALLAVLLHDRIWRDRFLDVLVPKKRGNDDIATVVQKLRRADDVEVTTEAWMGGAGNLDVAVFSRRENAVLVIETKTNSQLGKGQLTKYRAALRDSDPDRRRQDGPRRVFSTVLLRRPRKPDEPTGRDVDESHDRLGFNDSPLLTYADIEGLLPADADAADVRSGFVRRTVGHMRTLANPQPAAGRPLDGRKRVLEAVARTLAREAVGWHARRDGLSLRVTTPGNEAWHLSIGSQPRVLMSLVRGADSKNKVPFGVRGDRERVSPTEAGTYVYLGAGMPGLSIPTPFPTHERPWEKASDEHDDAQARVAVNILLDAYAAFVETRS